jgi:hypothetical protein
LLSSPAFEFNSRRYTSADAEDDADFDPDEYGDDVDEGDSDSGEEEERSVRRAVDAELEMNLRRSELKHVELELKLVGPLADVARHVIQRTLNPHLLSLMAPYDVASDVRQALEAGIGGGGGAQGEGRAGAGGDHAGGVPAAGARGVGGGRGLHSSTFRLNVSAFFVTWGAYRG